MIEFLVSGAFVLLLVAGLYLSLRAYGDHDEAPPADPRG